MNRAQRKAHARTWRFIALVLVAVIAAALAVKQRIDSVSDAVEQSPPR